MDVAMMAEAVPALEFGRRLVPATGVVLLTAGTLGYLRRTRAERMLRDAAELRASLIHALAVPAYNRPPSWRTAPPPTTEPVRRSQPSPYAPQPPDPPYAAVPAPPPVSPSAYAAIPWEQAGGQDLRQTVRARYRALAFAIAGALMVGTPLVSYAAGLRRDEAPAARVRVEFPMTAAGLMRVQPAPALAADIEERRRQAAAAGVDLRQGVYAHSADGRQLVLTVVVGEFRDPAASLQEALSGVATSVRAPLGPLHDVDPGPLGGMFRCTTLNTGPHSIGLCGWADDATVGLFAMNGWREADVAALLVRARGDIVHR